jgi:NADH-quinone oxidoreductase subunit C
MSDESLRDLGEHIAAELKGAVTRTSIAFEELTLETEAPHIVEVLTFLREDPTCRFMVLIDICGVDYPNRPRRFDVVYHLLSMHQNQRVRVKLQTDEASPVPSVISVYPAADWFEREAFDMYGIFFSDHPDLRRLLTDYGFVGHPFRKDFPLTGYVEVRWDEVEKRVVNEPVKLVQDFRSFDFMSPWEGAQYILPGDEKAAAPPPAEQKKG